VNDVDFPLDLLLFWKRRQKVSVKAWEGHSVPFPAYRPGEVWLPESGADELVVIRE